MTFDVLNDDFDDKREVMMSACGVGNGEKLELFDELSTTVCSGYTSKKDFARTYLK